MPEMEVTTDRRIYNEIKPMNIDFEEREVPITQIRTDGYRIGVNNRPLRKPHLHKISANHTGRIPHPTVVYHKSEGTYYIVDGNHNYSSYIEKMMGGELPTIQSIFCSILKYNDGSLLEASKPKDASLCFEMSYRQNGGQERNCVPDTIAMIMEISRRFKKESHKVHGIIDYIFNNLPDCKVISKETIKRYLTYGRFLEGNDLLETAQKERWSKELIDSTMNDYKLEKKYDKFTIKVLCKYSERFKEGGFRNPILWSKILNTEINMTELVDLIKSKSVP